MGTTSPAEFSGPAKPARLVSLDAYRGFIMLAMASSGFAFARVVKQHPDLEQNPVWQFLAYEFDHVAWTGCSFWDLIQPSFMFMVGVALPYSYASRKARGDSETRIFVHTLIRSAVLIWLGIFLSSNGSKQTNYTFVNVLTQIGLGYTFVYLLVGRGWAIQLAAIVAILAGYWALFATYPLPPPDFDYAAVNAANERLPGFLAHWDKNANFASAFDLRFLNLFPRPEPFKFNEGGYQTLNFVPSIATMIFGLMAGEMLRGERTRRFKLLWLFVAGALCLVVGLVLSEGIRRVPWDLYGDQYLVPPVCPSVKRIWTPSWAVFSSGWTFWMLAAFYLVIDVAGFRWWAFPLVVVGMNSITMYCMSQLMRGWVRHSLQVHIGQHIFEGMYGPIVESTTILLVLWLICYWLYRQKIFVRI